MTDPQSPAASRLSRTDEKLVEFSNGCICCTLCEDLLQEVANLAREGRFDYLLVESTGISEPLPVAETFTFTDEQGQSLSNLARLDTLVTVVDAKNFLTDYCSRNELRDRGVGLDDNDARNIVRLLVDQIEFANVIVVNKTDLVTAEELGFLEAVLRKVNPRAIFVRAARGQVPLAELLHTRRFDMEQAADHPGWLASAEQDEWPEELDPDEIEAIWEEPWGDRRQELVVIGMKLKDRLLAELDACCLTDAEMELGPAGWLAFDDPFPAWVIASGDGDDADDTVVEDDAP
jgi:G3E family GTPase